MTFALLESGLTETDIANRTGIHQTTISKVVRGDTKDMLLSTYRKLEALHAQAFPQQPA